jgi:hypothetical protein
LFGDLVLFSDRDDNPVVEGVVNFSGVDINVIKENKSPRVNERKTIDEDIHFLFEDLTLLIVDDLLDDSVARDDFV